MSDKYSIHVTYIAMCICKLLYGNTLHLKSFVKYLYNCFYYNLCTYLTTILCQGKCCK